MTVNSNMILKIRAERVSSIIRWSSLSLLLLLLFSTNAFSQVINNTGAVINVTAGTFVTSKDATNTTGQLFNQGTINLSGNFTNTATTTANGLFRIGGNWTNTGGIFNPGTSTVIFNGANNQVITRAGGETFFNMSVSNTGASGVNRVGISNIVTVTGTLSMSTGHIDAGAFKLVLSNPLPAALNYISSTGSRIFGKFERGVNQTGTYLFPLGTNANYNPANLKPNNVTVSGTIISEFLTPPSIDSLGLPLPDPPDEVARVFQDGYWNLTANGFSTTDYNINLDGSGFTTFPVRDMTRIINRPTGGNWALEGTHSAATGTVVYRNNLNGGISAAGSQYALAQTRPRIVKQPRDTIVCENEDALFEIFVTSTRSLTYTWYKEPATPLTGSHYNTAGPGVLIIKNVTLADAGKYYCIVTDYYGVTVRTTSATLTVNKRPVATATPNMQPHKCSNVAFDNIVLGETYGVPGTTYIWTRDNPSGITSLVPLSGTAPNIGDFLSGTFTNTSDSPITVTFSITPVGPAVTFCTGQTINAYVTVNPTPRVVVDPVSFKTDICDVRNANGSLNPTSVKLTTPSVMTMGVIRFDYTVSLSGLPGQVIGNTTPVNNVVPNTVLAFTYQNTTDTMQSVTYSVIPKVVSGPLCPNGITQNPEVKIHPLPLPRLPLSIDVIDPLTCGDGSDLATLGAIISKGASPYSLLWERSPAGGFTPVVNQIQVNVPSGRYNLSVTDNLGCYKKDVIDVFDITVTGIIYSKTKDPGPGHVTCIGDSDGYLYISADGGITYPYNYWLVRGTNDTVASGIFTNNQNYPADPSTFREFYNLPVGKYTLIIRDVNGCTVKPFETLKNPPPMVSVLNGTNVSCLGYNDGSARVQSITGGRGYYKYNWFTTDGFIPGPVNTNQINNLIAGTYYVEIRDTLNCLKLDSIKITQPNGISLASYTLSKSPDNNFNIKCNGGNDGSINITLAGGSGNFVYNWSGPSGFTATTEDLSGLKAGTYVATINDVSNPLCILMPKPTFTLTEPNVLAISSVKSLSADGGYNINCAGSATGAINLTVTGGSVGTYIYNWTTTGGSGIVAGQEDQSALTAGIYNVVVSDLNTCSTPLNNITLTQPAQLTVALVPTDITCLANGSIALTASGGILPYSYSWTGPGGYTSSSQNISNLTQGNYTVTVTDANGCIKNGSATINPPPPLSFTSTTSNYNGFNISCYGKSDGSINIGNITGTAPYTYSWTGPGGYTSSSQNISGLVSGTYQLVITDKNTCTATGSFTLSDQGKMSMIITSSLSYFGDYNINCRDSLTGTIDINPVNPAGTVTYLWSDGLISKTRTNLGAGTYNVIILDQNNCHTDSTVTLTEPDSIKIGFEVVQAFCPDSPDGQITTTVTGGVITSDYLYKWDPGNMTTQNLTNILEGHYILTVTDANGCKAQNSVDMEPQNETCLVIPNAISPNDDNINDIWNIGMIHLYPDIEIRIYNSWGQMVWKSAKGYPDKWDGRSNGVKLPIDSYHYVIDLHNGSKPVVGTITIVR
jgi:gliding motility-associated-like protein